MTILHIAGAILIGIGIIAVARWIYANRNAGSAFGNDGLDSRKLGGSMTLPRKEED